MKNPLTQLWNRFVTRPARTLANAARSTIVSLSMAYHVTAANHWRDLFNPLRGLTMARLVTFFEQAERGAYADLMWLYRFVEKRDATLRGGKRSLISAVAEMEWDIKTVEDVRLPAGCTPQMAEAQATELRAGYERLSNLTEAIEFLCLSEFRGFAHLEKIYEADFTITELRPVEQWFWCRYFHDGPWMYNADARSGRVQGEPVDLARFIVREVHDPINEIAAIAFVRKQLSRKDWDGFVESFGIPSIFAVMPPNVPQGREAEYQQLAEDVISNSRGALPNGSDIKTVDAGARGAAPFKEHIEQLDKEIVMAITSGMLTMLAESGSGTLAGGAHEETFKRIARSLAKRISETFQKQLDVELLNRAFPGQPRLAYFTILANEEVDTSAIIDDVAKLGQAGYDVDLSQLEERTSYKVTKRPDAGAGHAPNLPPLPNRAPAKDDPGAEPLDPTEDMLAASLDGLLEGMHEDFMPVAKRLQGLLTDAESEEDLKAGVELLMEDLPKLAAEVGASEATVANWQKILGTAAANEAVAS